MPPDMRAMQGETILADFVERARRRLAGNICQNLMLAGGSVYGDHRLSPDLPGFDSIKTQPAAVLIAIMERPSGATVLFTRRAADLRSHSGQVAFPGGKIDSTDDSPVAAALREAEEEVGISPAMLQPFGCLPPYQSYSGYKIVPVVALAAPGISLTLNPQEVSAVFECPLAFLMDPLNHTVESRLWQGIQRHYYAIYWQDNYIWGVTAGIVRALYETVYDESRTQ